MYHRFCGMTIIAVLMLFFLGGLVRVTESGMGCPDWPKCFGSWVPPTSEASLPDNYKALFEDKRQSKIDRLVTFLNKIGMTNKAEAIAGNDGLLQAHAYSFPKAYTEYINRLFGALTGIFALLASWFSLKYFTADRPKMVFTLLGLFFIILNGWLGSLVVDTNLFPGMVTVHFVIAFLAVASFLVAYYRGKQAINTAPTGVQSALLIFAFALGVIQLLSGTLVREVADAVAMTGVLINTENYPLLGNSFQYHRFAAFALFVTLLLVWILGKKSQGRRSINRFYVAMMALTLLQIITGVLNIRMSFPPVVQLIHVVAGSLVLTGLIFTAIQESKSKTAL